MIEVTDDTPIWRYMRLPQFIEMMLTMSLFESRVTNFDDKLEGAYGYRDITVDPGIMQFLDPPTDRTYHLPMTGSWSISVEPPTVEGAIREARLHTCVTCWYSHPGTESYAMWRVYGADSFAVALTTTAGELRRAFAGANNVIVGGVDYRPLPTAIGSVHELFFHKREEYESEREVRSVRVFADRLRGNAFAQPLTPEQLNALLREVVAAPGMRQSLFDSLRLLVISVLQTHGQAFDPGRFRRSALDNDMLD